MAPIVVFDFDRTLTHIDTILGFYRSCHGRSPLLPLKLAAFLSCAAGMKAGLIGADRLKDLGVRLFLSALERGEVARRGREYAKRIELNRIYREEFVKHEHAIVLSASFREYLTPIFPDSTVIASEIRFAGDKPAGVLQHCHGDRKVAMLRERGIDRVDAFYTDSVDDLPVVRISDVTFLVRREQLIECRTQKNFLHNAGRRGVEAEGRALPS